MKLKSHTKRVHDGLSDIDYLDKLPSDALSWMEVFLRATLTLDSEAIGSLEAGHPELRRAVYNEDRAQRRDIMYVGSRMDMDELLLNGPGPALCPHCCKAKCKCAPRKRRSRYSQADYYR